VAWWASLMERVRTVQRSDSAGEEAVEVVNPVRSQIHEGGQAGIGILAVPHHPIRSADEVVQHLHHAEVRREAETCSSGQTTACRDPSWSAVAALARRVSLVIRVHSRSLDESLGMKVPVDPPDRSGGVGAPVTMLIGSGLRPRMVEGSYSDMSLSPSSASGGVLNRPSFEEKLLDDSGVEGCWCANDWNGSGSEDDSS
jgi:hypothetical protein